MQARLVNIGYGTIIAVDRIIAVVAPEFLPQFSSKYKVLTWYAWHCWQVEVVEDIENKEEVKEQLRAISEFANFYINSKMQHYNPF